MGRVKRVKRQLTEWEKMSDILKTSHKGLIFKVYKELQKGIAKIQNPNPNHPTNRRTSEVNKQFPKKKYKRSVNTRKCTQYSWP